MEEKNMETMVIEIEEKEYKLGFKSRTGVMKAEELGLKLSQIEEKPITVTAKLFYTGLLANQPSITEDEANRLLDKYIEEGGEVGEFNSFLIQQIVGLQQSPNTKKKKKAKIIKM